MNSVRFSARPGRKWIAVLIWLPMLGGAALVAYQSIADLQTISLSADEWGNDMSWLKAAKAVLAVAALSLAPPILVGNYRRNAPERNFLQLDQDGFRYVWAGKSRHWPWSALPAFKTVLRYRQVQFVLPEGDTKSKRRDPWIHEVTPDGPVVAIRDYYDTPFDEIAAKLNEYRDWALAASGAGTAG